MPRIFITVDGSTITVERNPPNHGKAVRELEKYCLAHYGSQAYTTSKYDTGVWFGYNLPASNGHGFYAEWAEISFNQLPKEVRLYLLIEA